MDASAEQYVGLIRSAAQRLEGHERRLFQAEVATRLCGGNPRQAEERFGWGRDTVRKGLREASGGIRCVEHFAAKGKKRREEADPALAQDIRAIVEPHTQADPELKSQRRYTNLSAKEVLEALRAGKGYEADGLPGERSMRQILNRMNYRLKRIQKARPLKKTRDTDAIFENVAAAREKYRGDPETLEISIDTKAKVSEGDYSRGGKKPDRLGGRNPEGVGP
jgi:Rhodopirellula transposase DDE domain